MRKRRPERLSVFTNLPAFAAGMAAVLVAYAVFADVHAQPENRAVVACADAQGQLRMPDPPGACAAGETLVPLKSIDVRPEEKPQKDPATAELERRLSELEARLRGKAKPGDGTVEAPFEVFNDAGVKIFSVAEQSLGDRQVNVFNNAGKEVAWIYGGDNRGWIRIMSATSDLFTELDPHGLTVRNHDLDRHRVDLGPTEDTRHGLRLINMKGQIVAGIGQSSVESGVAIVADELGRPRLRMLMAGPDATVGRVAIVNIGGTEVATLSVDERQSGLMQLRNDAGEVMVEAGTLEAVGVVRAGPGAFQHAFGFLGLPASYIQGKPQ